MSGIGHVTWFAADGPSGRTNGGAADESRRLLSTGLTSASAGLR